MVNDVVWKKFYKKARVACADNIVKVSRVKQNSLDKITKYRNEFDFEKHVDAPVLEYSSDTDPYALTTDAFLTGNGAILNQIQGTGERDIAYKKQESHVRKTL